MRGSGRAFCVVMPLPIAGVASLVGMLACAGAVSARAVRTAHVHHLSYSEL